MHAVFIVSQVEPRFAAEAAERLKSFVAPRFQALDGFVQGTWAYSAETGEARSVLLFGTEADAQRALDATRGHAGDTGPVRLVSASTLEVVLHTGA
jgi:hypothetical protein